MYRRCLERLVEERCQREPGRIAIMAATHNEDTVRLAQLRGPSKAILISHSQICGELLLELPIFTAVQLELLRRCDLSHQDPSFYFAQLYGMCDQVVWIFSSSPCLILFQVSFSLGQAGYNVCKCLHYGPLKDVLPYSLKALQMVLVAIIQVSLPKGIGKWKYAEESKQREKVLLWSIR